MTPVEIKIELLKRGISQGEIAEAIDEDRGTVSGVVNGKRKTLRVRQYIAKALGKPLLKVFPEEAYRSPDSGRILKRAGFKV